MASVGSVLDPIEFQQPRVSTAGEVSECEHEGEGEVLDEDEYGDEIMEVSRSRSGSVGSGDIIDEFGRCPVRQARIERKNIANDVEEV